MKSKIVLGWTIILMEIFLILSCKKYLDAKPDQSLVIPQTVEELQALLDMNNYMNLQSPSLPETSCDNYFLKPPDVNGLAPYQRNAYLWDTAGYPIFPNDWAFCYQTVYLSNTVLDNISKIERTSENQFNWDNVKGSALLYRAKSFLVGTWLWANAYDSITSKMDLGIPLRLSSDFNIPSVRGNVQDCYNQIISDLMESVSLLPNTPAHVMRPSKAAAYAFLARTFLSMRKYDSCFKYADLCLKIKSILIDYNTINGSLLYPFPRFNDEVIFHTRMTKIYKNLSVGRIDTILYNSYDSNDLRLTLFFKPTGDGYFKFTGSYDNSAFPWDGIATDEVYLMRAEANARLSNVGAAMEDLNMLLATRWKSSTFVPLQANDGEDALNQILIERRKELIWRNLRWMDIKRLNKEGRNIIIKRIVDDVTYSLAPNDNRYALPLPLDIIALSGMPQNMH